MLPYHCLFIGLLWKDDDLDEDDKQALRVFAWKVKHHTTDAALADLPYVFPHTNVESWKVLRTHIAKLSNFEPSIYDCCRKSCICYVGPYADLNQCPYCSLPRFDGSGKSHNHFTYLPIIPRLQQYFSNSAMASLMKYRSEHIYEEGKITDIMDSEIYRDLLQKPVELDGKPLGHTFFDDDRDIAFGLSTDGFAPFRRRTKTAWPLVLFNYNLPPEIRFHVEHILPLGVVPGPNKPKDFDSFLWPAIEEFLRLEAGVHTYDHQIHEFFALRAYLLLAFGDIPAISMLMRMKGHNGTCPCRMCSIQGVAAPGGCGTTLYVPLDRGWHPDVALSQRNYDPEHLPLRTHTGFLAQARAVQFATTQNESEALAKQYGIKGVPLLSVLSSLSFPRSFPYDFMHLLWENVMKNLMQLWTGTYKGLDSGSEDYQISSTVWDAIGEACENSGDSIPSVFGPRPPNVAASKSSWTADTRSFWTLYIGPVVLDNRFKKQKYYDHFVDLVKLLNICLQFEVSTSEIAHLRSGLIKWVKKYEEYVRLTSIVADDADTLFGQNLFPVHARPTVNMYTHYSRSSTHRG